MDFELLKTFYLEKKIFEPCGYKELLNPRIENGGFINMSIPELRKGLEGCFGETDNIIIQEYLIEYLEDKLLFIKYDFEQDKNKLTLLKRDEKNLKLSNKLYVSDELRSLTYVVEYKKMMLQTVNKWLDKKRYYIDNYVEINKEKIELEQEQTKNLVRRVIANIKKDNNYPAYCEVGALFAQGFIKKVNSDYYFKDKKFKSAYALSKYLKEDILMTNKTVNNYINDTFNTGKHNFYNSKTMMKEVIKYCKVHNIDITTDFIDKYNQLQ